MITAGPKLKTGSFVITASVDWTCPVSGCQQGSPVIGTVTIDVVGDEDGEGCSGSCTTKPSLGTGSFGQDGLDFKLNLGAANVDANQQYKTAGYLALKADTASASLATPAALVMPYKRPSVDRVPASLGSPVQQVKTPQGLVQVTSVDNGYSLSVYDKTQVGAKSGGVYPLNQNATPFVIWTIINPSGNQNSLQVTEDRSGQQNVNLYAYTVNGSTATWNLTRPDNTYTVSQKTDGANNGYTRTFELRNADTTLVQKSVKTYEYFSLLNDVLMTQLTEGDGATTRTTTYTYYTDETTTPAAVRLRSVVYPDGNWTYYKYENWLGRKQFEYEPYNNTTAPTSDTDPVLDQCKKTEYQYDDSLLATMYLIEKTIVSLPADANGQQEVARTTIARDYDDDGLLSQMTVTAPEGMVTTTKYITTQGSTLSLVASVTRPDGTKSYFQYSTDANGVTTTSEDVGEPNGSTGILNGQHIVTQTDITGRVLSRVATAIQAGVTGATLSSQLYQYATGSQNYSITDQLTSLTTSYTYSCCGLSDVIDPEGVVTHYDYDGLHRQVASQVLRGGAYGVKTTNILDAAGQVLVVKRIGKQETASQAVTIQQYQYDVLGRVIRGTNALGGVTTNLYLVDSGRRRDVTLYPDGGTRTDDYYLDGRLQKLTGTAVAPAQYEYGLEEETKEEVEFWYQYVKETKLNASWQTTSEWTKTYTDGAGRTFKTLYPAATGSPYKQSWYNSYGQLSKERDPDGVVTLYEYNAQGQLTYTALDLDGDDARDTALDRVSLAERTILSDRIRTDTSIWLDVPNSGSVKKLVSRSEVSTSGLHTWQTVWRTAGDDNTQAVTESLTAISPATGQRTLTVTGPDGTQSVSVYSYGLLQSVTRKDSTAGHSQWTQMTYAYDKYDRQITATDARCGATTLVLNDADLVTSTTTTPDAGGGAQVTTTFYDKLGRATGTRYPDATTVTNFYSPAGLLTKTYGSRTYPVEYAYDIQGRMATMKTWQSFAANGGTATTTWNYDLYRGWLSSKDYPDKDTGNPPATAGTSGPQYAYTPGGRLMTRTWLRRGTSNNRILTSYTYGFDQTGTKHGDLVGVTYNNDPVSTPSISYSYDRLGRRSQVIQNFQNGQDSITTSLAYNDASQFLSESYANGLLAGLSVGSTFNNSLQRTALSLSGISGTYSASYGYDTAGRLQTVTSGANVATYSYLANSPLVNQIVFATNGTTRMTTTKQYDRLNRLQAISSVSPVQSVAGFGYLYNAANQRTRSTLADGSYWLYSYDSLGQVVSGKRFWQDGTPVAGQQYEYGFDDIGNRKSASMGGDAYGGPLRQARYDTPTPPNRLNQYVQRDVPAKVDIMGIANPTASVSVNNNPVYRKGEYYDYALSTPNDGGLWYGTVTNHSSYGAGQDSTGKLFVPKSQEQFIYDLDGNLTNDGHWAYTWDAENRLVRMTNNATTGPQQGLAFEYDWSGRRIHKQVWSQGVAPTNNVKFLYDGWNLLAEVNATNNAVIRSFLWGNDLSGSPQGAGGVGGLLMVAYTGTQTTNCFVAFDGNGNVAALADVGSTNVFAQYEYGPFGEVIRATGPMAKANPFRWSTQYQDDETDLVCYLHRYYSPSTGRWPNRDPLAELGGLNLYSFVYNNPLTYWDYLGNDPQSNLDLLKEELGDEAYDATLCKKFSSGATGVLNETPIGQAKIVLTGKDLLDKPVGGGEQAAAGVGFGLPLIKKAGQCCKALYVCVKVRLFVKKTKLNNLDVYVGLIQDGKVIKSVPYPDNPSLAPSHESLAKQLGLLGEDGKLPPGVEAFTVCKQDGKLGFRGSNNFDPELSPEARKKLEGLFE
ncbi:MAG: RHS repeat-associated core domain-containing protein [Verrucomicrobiota bacterium]